jgi:hypothetical protein
VAHSGSIGPSGTTPTPQSRSIPQDVVHLTVRVATRERPEVTPLWCITTGSQDDAHHGDLLQVFPGMAGAAREVGRHRSGDVSMLEREGSGGGMGMVAAMGPAPTGLRRAGRSPGVDVLVPVGLSSPCLIAVDPSQAHCPNRVPGPSTPSPAPPAAGCGDLGYRYPPRRSGGRTSRS